MMTDLDDCYGSVACGSMSLLGYCGVIIIVLFLVINSIALLDIT